MKSDSPVEKSERNTCQDRHQIGQEIKEQPGDIRPFSWIGINDSRRREGQPAGNVQDPERKIPGFQFAEIHGPLSPGVPSDDHPDLDKTRLFEYFEMMFFGISLGQTLAHIIQSSADDVLPLMSGRFDP